jgi:hypothetical protein
MFCAEVFYDEHPSFLFFDQFATKFLMRLLALPLLFAGLAELKNSARAERAFMNFYAEETSSNSISLPTITKPPSAFVESKTTLEPGSSQAHSYTQQSLTVYFSNCVTQHQISWLTTARKHLRV